MQMYQRKTDELSLAAVMVLMISVKVSLFLGVDEFPLVVSYKSLLFYIFLSCERKLLFSLHSLRKMAIGTVD
jgi:hypothetical protein